MTRNHKNHYQKLKKRILAAMIVVPAVPFALLLIIGYRYFTSTLEENARFGMSRMAEDHGLAIETFLHERRTDLKLLANTYEFSQISDPKVLKQAFDHLTDKSPAFFDLGVFDQQGTQVAYQGPFELAGRDYAQAKWFLEVKKRGYYVSDVFLGYRRIPHFVIAVVKREQGLSWVIRATIDTGQFSSLVEKVRIGRTGEAYIVNQEGLLQTQRLSGPGLLELDPWSARYLEASPRGGRSATKPEDGTSFIWATASLNDGKWLLVVRQAQSDAFEALRSVTYLVLLVTLFGGVLIIGLGLSTTSHIIKRMETADEEKDRLGQQLVVAGRLAEVGEMSAGFAHEVNNPLQIISSEQKLARTTLEDMIEAGQVYPGENLTEVLDCIDQIKLQVDRCGKITRALLKFARQTEPAVELVDLAGFIPSAVSLVQNKARISDIGIEQDVPQENLSVKGDPGQLQQVLVNLINNAIDAVGSRKPAEGGLIRVAARRDSDRIRISINDNGSGISPENMEKIFTPFFTTKPVGEGTGLGLPICFGIVDQMGGNLEVESLEGRGTTMTINLPAV